MRIPTRRGEKERAALAEPEDHHLTPQAVSRLKRELEDLLQYKRPEAINEVRRLAEMGDFSENAGYQIAKATLRRINSRIDVLQQRLKTAVVIPIGPSADGRVRIGSTVELKKNDRTVSYQILGSLETNPSAGRISHRSPLGQALLGGTAGESVQVAGHTYTIIAVH